MNILKLQQDQNIKKSEISRVTGIPYSTICDIFSGKARLLNCSADTIFRLSQFFNLSMEDLLAPFLHERPSFENYKSALLHKLKELGDLAFIEYVLSEGLVNTYYNRDWNVECLYLLSLVDYLSRINGLPLIREYDELRKLKIDNIIYPQDTMLLYKLSHDERILQNAKYASIKEFLDHNIVETDVRNVI